MSRTTKAVSRPVDSYWGSPKLASIVVEWQELYTTSTNGPSRFDVRLHYFGVNTGIRKPVSKPRVLLRRDAEEVIRDVGVTRP